MTKVLLLFLGMAISGCWTEPYRREIRSLSAHTRDATDTTSYPLIIDNGTKIIYQFGHMTPDKGLKVYLDTIPHPAGGFKLDEQLRTQLSPGE